MAVYLLVDVDIRDLGAYEEYKNGVSPLVAKHGGEYLVRGGDFEVLEGDWTPSRLVLFRFPNREAVQSLFEDAEYQPLKQLRHRVAETNIVVMNGN